MRRYLRAVFAVLAVAVTVGWLVAEADARVGGGSSSGSRGSRTFSAPPTTRTAPTQSAPMQRTITQPNQPGSATAAARPATQSNSWFNRPGMGLLGGLAAGFLGAGLFGMLLGHGFGGAAGLFGLLMQAALIGGVIWLVLRLVRRPAPAYAGNAPSPRQGLDFGGNAGGYGFGGGPGQSGPVMHTAGFDGVGLTAEDFDAFERLLGEIELAYGRGDHAVLRQAATAEMSGYFAADLADDAAHGRQNRIDDVKLLQGDLAEAWREGTTDYATVAMRFSLIDRTVEVASGRILEGSEEPTETTEVWTFRRDQNGPWKLSAIQPA